MRLIQRLLSLTCLFPVCPKHFIQIKILRKSYTRMQRKKEIESKRKELGYRCIHCLMPVHGEASSLNIQINKAIKTKIKISIKLWKLFLQRIINFVA